LSIPRRSPGLDPKPFYTLGELATASGLSRKRVLRLLREAAVRTTPPATTQGKKILISFLALERALPEFLERMDESDRR
jgi:hypothetical protein